MSLERGLRAAAILIAVLAVVDPSVMSTGGRQTVVVLPSRDGSPMRAGQVAAAIASAFEVSTVDVPAPAAYVLTGADLPEDWAPEPEAIVFAVTPATSSTDLQIARLAAPAALSVDSVGRIDVEALVGGSGDRDVTFTLVVDGARLQTATSHVADQESRATASLTLVPVKPGLVHVRILADAPGRRTAAADAALVVTARQWPILAFDARPTYSSTFIRRALESDPRFAVTTRIATSRLSAIQTSTPPASLDDPAGLARFDVVIVGAADSASAAEALALRAYLRERHGAVVLLPERPAGPLLTTLTGQDSWREDRRGDPAAVASAAASWSASEFIWPGSWPALTVPLATFAEPAAGRQPAFPVWQMPVGAGRLVVSSAVDGWRTRSGASLGFSLFWRSITAALAEATPPEIRVDLAGRLFTRGQPVDVTVELLSPDEPAARLRNISGVMSAVRLWPLGPPRAGAPRTLSGAVRAPDLPGHYRVEVTTGSGASGAGEFLVVDEDALGGVPLRLPSARNGLAAVAASAHRGEVVPADRIETLPARIAAAAGTPAARQPWHPMRSLWWLVPFTVCASGEWWLRRRRGER